MAELEESINEAENMQNVQQEDKIDSSSKKEVQESNKSIAPNEEKKENTLKNGDEVKSDGDSEMELPPKNLQDLEACIERVILLFEKRIYEFNKLQSHV